VLRSRAGRAVAPPRGARIPPETTLSGHRSPPWSAWSIRPSWPCRGRLAGYTGGFV